VTRELIVVDVETTGLDPRRHAVVEVAAVNVATGEHLHFIPRLPSTAGINFEALRINGYVTRRLYDEQLDDFATSTAYEELFEWLEGNTLAGANPAFDAAFLTVAAADHCIAPGWHFRLADLAAYAAPLLGLAPTELPGLNTVCDRLNVINTGPHTALGDAIATAECFRRLAAIVPPQTPDLPSTGWWIGGAPTPSFGGGVGGDGRVDATTVASAAVPPQHP
jgi:DNA polymerase-3 subunit epsilon